MEPHREPLSPATATPLASSALPLLLCGVTLLATLLLFWPTAWSMVRIWERSETFAHGYVILPISLWLVWRKRAALALVTPRVEWRGLVLLALLGFGWLLARVADVQVVQQLAFVGMLPTLVLTCLGWPLVRVILFPLLFLFFAVPMGEGLIPHLMEFTALFTVTALRLTGLPVYWEGLYFSIPSGNWSVVEACSGVRYLIASVTIGSLYAYLTYRSYWRRAIFIAMAVLVPIVANGLRAYMIVMIGHLSDMKLAQGVDHFIYGWVFFGFVMLLLFWVGSYWREDEATAEEAAGARDMLATPASASRVAVVAVAGLAILLVWPAWAYHLGQERSDWMPGQYQAVAPLASNGWEVVDHDWLDWKPRYIAPDQEIQLSYRQSDQPVGLYLAFYGRQQQDAELVNTQNVMVPQKHPVWREVQRTRTVVDLSGSRLRVSQSRLSGSGQRILVWHWYWLEGTHTSSNVLAKLIEARNRLLGGRHPAVGIVLYTPYDHDRDGAERYLQDFLDAMLEPLEAELARLD
jgi:exosortase A